MDKLCYFCFFCHGNCNETIPNAESKKKDIGQATNKTFCGIQKAYSTEFCFHLKKKKRVQHAKAAKTHYINILKVKKCNYGTGAKRTNINGKVN